MSPELQKTLFDRYPHLFERRHLGMDESPMHWGITCGDGWYRLIDEMSLELETEGEMLGEDIQYDQVKEKLGILTVYLTEYNPYARTIIRKYQDASSQTCEKCGKPGNLRPGRWIQTLCDGCWTVKEILSNIKL